MLRGSEWPAETCSAYCWSWFCSFFFPQSLRLVCESEAERFQTFKVAFLSRIHMVIRSGDTEGKQSCVHATRAANILRFPQDVPRRRRDRQRCFSLYSENRDCSSLLCKYDARFEITASGTVTCGGTAFTSIFTVVFILWIQSSAALSPECDINASTFQLNALRRLIEVLLTWNLSIWRLVQKRAHVGWGSSSLRG